MLAYKQAVEEIRQLPSVQESRLPQRFPLMARHIDEDIQRPWAGQATFRGKFDRPRLLQDSLRPALPEDANFAGRTQTDRERKLWNFASAALDCCFPDDPGFWGGV